MIMNGGQSNMMVDFVRMLFSSIPESEFETRLKEFGIEDKNIIKLKEMAGYNSQPKGGDDK